MGAITEEERQEIVREYESLVSNTLVSWNVQNYFNRKKLQEEPAILKRLVDALGSAYDKRYQALPEDRYIDEITYLELSKNLTPQASRTKPIDVLPICKVLKFDEDSDTG